tara:strand:+ start:2162 stop:2920 length:759 start_codon:yes stop_codon:yes gene_type:complete
VKNKLSENMNIDKNKSSLTKLSISLKKIYLRFSTKHDYLKTISALIVFFILLSPWLQPRAKPGFEFLVGETGVIELVQNFLLLFHLYFLFRNYKLVKVITRTRYLLAKIFLVFFLIYEELSFLTTGFIEFTQGFNIQNELNMHNAEFLAFVIIEELPLLDSVSISPILYVLFFVLFGFGCYLRIPEETKFLFLDKKLSIFSQLYFINFLVTRGLAMPFNIFVIDPELIETLFYLIFLLDTLAKNAKAKHKAQ